MNRAGIAMTSAVVAAMTAGAVVLSTVSASAVPAARTAPAAGVVAGKVSDLPAKRSSLPWRSGAWTGGKLSDDRTTAFGAWRGTPTDVAMTYPERGSWKDMESSTWHIDTYSKFPGTLMYGMPLLPGDGSASLADVAAGKHDATFAKIASDLKSKGRGNAIVRIGWEANGDWYPWQGTADNAEDFKAAFRRVAKVMRGVSPKFVIGFDVSAGYGLKGGSNRLDALTKLYPGDDVVDVVGVDVYDWNTVGATDASEWKQAVSPSNGPGIADVATFARKHGKGLVVPEWGVAKEESGGNGDNPFFIKMMHQFFQQNRDILVAELYFNEPDSYIKSGLWESDDNPEAAAAYRSLW